MVVGPTGGGKSVVINMLAQSQTKLGLPTKLYTINPKERGVNELYGVLDPLSRDWTDGLLSNIFRDVNKPTEKTEMKYIVFDGDVDALWVENMNSVMDDNRLLTLANGERIRLQKHAALLFEVYDLQYASPATVSRCGMVYVDPKNLGYEPFWLKWLNTRTNKLEKEQLGILYKKYIPLSINFIVEGMMGERQGAKLKCVIPLTNLNMVMQLTKMLSSVMIEGADSPDVIEACFIQAMFASLGAALLEDDRVKYDEYFRTLSSLPTKATDDETASPGEVPGNEATVFEYFFDADQLLWIPWIRLVPEYIHDPATKFNKILVPTVDTVRTMWLLKLMVEKKYPILLCGDSGTSKTATTVTYLRSLDRDVYKLLEINFSSRTTSLDVQRNLEANVEKRIKDTYGPPMGKRLIVFIDDMNMPSVDTYGTQQPIAMLKLLLDREGCYDRGKDLAWKFIKDIDWVAAMGKPGGGRNDVDPRFISLFTVFNMTFPSEASQFHIYNSILAGHALPFSEEIQGSVPSITKMTLVLYNKIILYLPPTPAKFHYIFNLRDLSRIYNGMCLTTTDKYTTVQHFVRVWRHEVTRVIFDRLISEADYTLVRDFLIEELTANFAPITEAVMVDPILYGDYRNALELSEPRLYEDLVDFKNTGAILAEVKEAYNEMHLPLNLVLFDDMLDHITRVSRVLRMPQGHCLLIGMGCSGKHSIAQISAFVAECEIFELQLGRGYNEASFRDDLKLLYEKLGADNLKVVFFFTDQNVVEEGFLELVNNMLTSGMVPALFNEEEKDALVGMVQEAAVNAGSVPSRDAVWQYFLTTCTNNLHVVVSMTPMGEALSRRCRNFPGMVNNTNIDWLFPWPKEALLAVAYDLVRKDNVLIPAKLRDSIIDLMVHIHYTVIDISKGFTQKMRRDNYVTPKSYLDFIGTYLRLLADRNVANVAQCERLISGMEKLVQSNAELKILNAMLDAQRIEVDKKTEICRVLLITIVSSTSEAEEKKITVLQKGKEIVEQNKIIEVEKREAEDILEEALPALEAAKAALDDLDKNDVTEIRSFAKPPKPVQTIGECIVVLKGIKEVSWKSAKGLMSDPNFLRSLKEMDVDSITPKQVNTVRGFLAEMNISQEDMKKTSRAGAGLMKFVLAIIGYCAIASEVKPKRFGSKLIVLLLLLTVTYPSADGYGA